MIAIFVRTFILYILLTLIFRMMGKRQVGELEMSDLVSTLLLSEIAALPIDSPDIPLLYAIIPIGVIMCLEVIITYAKTKCNWLKKCFEGEPVLLICRGEIRTEALESMRITLDELLSECRQLGISDICQVNYAILEPNGKLSVFPKTEYAPLTPSVLHKKVEESGILHTLVIDGAVQSQNLSLLKMTEKDIKRICQSHHTPLSQVLLIGIDDGGHITFIPRKEGQK